MRINNLALSLFASALFTGCGSGTVAIVDAANDDGSSNARPAINDAGSFGNRTSPSVLRFELIDADGDDVDLAIRLPGGAPATLVEGDFTLGNGNVRSATTKLTNLNASPSGSLHYKLWDYVADGFAPDAVNSATLRLVPDGGNSRTVTVVVGNTVPSMHILEHATAMTGLELIRFGVQDTDGFGDEVRIRTEFRVTSTDPIGDWTLARPGDLNAGDMTPEYQTVAPTSVDGKTIANFLWDTAHDIEAESVSVELRFTVQEILHPDDSPNEIEVIVGDTDPISVDNNFDPIAIIQSDLIVASSDRRHGFAIPFDLIDADEHECQVVIQWTRAGEGFEDPGSTKQELEALLADPVARAAKRVCEELPTYIGGRVGALPPDADPSHELHLPELPTSAAALYALEGVDRPLELLRERRLTEPLPWAGALGDAVALLPLRHALHLGTGSDGLTAVALAQDGAAWDLVELDLTTGVTHAILDGQAGTATALALDESSGVAFVGSLMQPGDVAVSRVDLRAMSATSLTGSASDPAGVRGLAALTGDIVIGTVDDRLVRFEFGSSPIVNNLLLGLQSPHGVTLDPWNRERLLVAETGLDRIVRVDLRTLTMSALPVVDASGEPTAVPSPRSLAVEAGARLLVVAGDDLVAVPFGHTVELVGSEGADPILDTVFDDVDPQAQVATGADHLILLSRSSVPGGPIAAGGVRSRLHLAADLPLAPDGDRHRRSLVEVQESLPSQPPVGTLWRVPLGGSSFFPTDADGVRSTFVWDTRVAPLGGDYLLRVTPFDEEVGLASTFVTGLSLAGGLEESDFAGPAPSAIGAVDVDHDGDADVRVGGTDGVGVIRVEGPGELASTSVTVGDSFVAGGTFADLNGDGLLDIAKADPDVAQLWIAIQTTPGVYAPSISTPLTAISDLVQPVDWNRDGRTDFLARQGNQIVFLENDNLAFSTADTGISSFRPVGVADFDRDEAWDLAVLDGCTLDILLGGTGYTSGFGAPYDLAHCTFGVRLIEVADLDRDGLADVVCAEEERRLHPFFNDGSSFVAPEVLDYPGQIPFIDSVVVGDLDRNGLADLSVTACTQGDTSAYAAYLQTSDRRFVRDPLGPLDANLAGATRCANADITGDGALSLFVRGFDESRMYLPDPEGGFEPSETTVLLQGTGSRPRGLEVLDANGDVNLDLITIDTDSDEVVLFRQEGLGFFVTDPDERLSFGPELGSPDDLVSADLDGDGAPNVVVLHRSTEKLSFWSLENAAFEFLFDLSGVNEGAADLLLADIDGDQRLDVLLEADDMIMLYLQEDTGVGGPLEFRTTPLAVDTGMSQVLGIHAVDLDADGDVDLIGSALFSSNVFYQVGSDENGPLFGDGVPLPGGVRDWKDLDGDRDLDLVCSGIESISVVEQLTPQDFDSTTYCFFNLFPGSVQFDDVDRDGLMDLVAGVGGPQVFSGYIVMRQVVAGHFALTERLAPGGATSLSGSGGGRLVDLDGDGDRDFATLTGDGAVIVWGGH
ncbi:MAG: VCBS repeat-containing protein [bacterium]|nr:VCBS repeat-containing protein [bacterium]